MAGSYYPHFDRLQLPPGRAEFYRDVVGTLGEANLPFMLSGAYAFGFYTDVWRQTKDLDLFITPETVERALARLRERGFETELTFPHWLAKVRSGDGLTDLVFANSNGVCSVDETWFENAPTTEIFGHPARVVRAEDLIYSKAFVMERERFDGIDVLHLLHRQLESLDWDRILARFTQDQALLTALLALFQFVYPFRARDIPTEVRASLARRFAEPPLGEPGVCNGTLLSKRQFLVDVEGWGLTDARSSDDRCHISESDLRLWSEHEDAKPPAVSPQVT